MNQSNQNTIAPSFPTPETPRAHLVDLILRLRPRPSTRKLVRLGPLGDGGYLVPEDFDGISACFSPGVSYTSGFEVACAELGMHVFLADHSVDGPVVENERFMFTKKHVAATSSEDFMTMDSWVDEMLPESDSDLLLQMDIEGAEYEVFLNMSETLWQRFRIIVVEFHGLEMLWSQPFFLVAARVFENLLQRHTCVHLHPNNAFECFKYNGLEIPRIMEFTFLRNDRIGVIEAADKFPHPLDCDNTQNPTLPLPSCWFRS
jgi:hypothetical protein